MAETANTQHLQLNFRPPSSSPAEAPFDPPTTEWIAGTWHVKYSSLPMWKTKRNVKIIYTPLDDPAGGFDNLVTYQKLGSDKLETVKGIEKPDPSVPAAWNWRGKGLLIIASSHWETLSWGEEEGGWMVIYFEKTLFTPAGIDLLVKHKDSVSPPLLETITTRIKAVEDKDFRKCADEMFGVRHDP